MVWRPTLAALAALAAFTPEARADTFEFLTYTPPPGWSVQQDATGKSYVRKDSGGTGVIFLFPSRAATGTAAAAFAEDWRARVTPLMSAAAPEPAIQQHGEITVAVGGARGAVQGENVTAAFITIVDRRRALSVLGIASSNDVFAQISTFLDAIDVAPAGGQPPAAQPPAADAGELGMEFDVPPGYVAGRDGTGVLLKPKQQNNRDTPCTYGITLPHPTRGTLEADAQAALGDLLPGWRKRYSGDSDHYNKIKRGTAPAGWPFYAYRADMQRGDAEILTVMTMAVPAGPKQVTIVWGAGSVLCTAADVAFARLFHSLRPRGWVSDGGKALKQALVGSWATSASNFVGLYVFRADGSFDDGAQASHQRDLSDTTAIETTTTRTAVDSRYELRGNELKLTSKKGSRTFRVRILDEFDTIWMRSLYLLVDGANPPYEVHYARQNWTPPPR